MKAILISIRPEHLVNILNGKKTIEIRKSKLPLNVPVYLYCTKGKPTIVEAYSGVLKNEKPTYCDVNGLPPIVGKVLNGKVVAKCVFSDVFWLENEWASDRHSNGKFFYQDYFDKACIDRLEAWKYANGKDLYAYQISNLEIFDTLKELSEFNRCDGFIDCCKCKYYSLSNNMGVNCNYRPITKAPQSWCYMEVEE